ncbi:MAG TPA: iron ABC transporter permease [Anaerolineaceae bacterium]|nr:iron ABC transporter permease [Anaerolineaceae bacterium]
MAPLARSPQAARRGLGLLTLGLLLLLGGSLLLGRYPAPGFIDPARLWDDPLAQQLVWNLRLPRLLAAAVIGMSLAAAGVVFQMVFSNPLVEPGFLGVSQAAAFGAALAILVLGSAAWLVQGGAVLFGLLGLGASYVLARRVRYGGWVLRLVLSGIAISALFSAGVGVMKYLADPLRQLPEITFWLLGGLYGITWPRFLAALPLLLGGLAAMLLLRWRLNLLTLDEDAAAALGAPGGLERVVVLLAAVAATAASISIGGLIGWAGLITPHLARRLFGADARYALPGALLIGAIYLVICDDLARLLMMGEIPLGILTSLLGALAFLILLTRPLLQPQT